MLYLACTTTLSMTFSLTKQVTLSVPEVNVPPTKRFKSKLQMNKEHMVLV